MNVLTIFGDDQLCDLKAEREEAVRLPLPAERRGRQGRPPAVRGCREDASFHQVHVVHHDIGILYY